jgi:hypothetical protein
MLETNNKYILIIDNEKIYQERFRFFSQVMHQEELQEIFYNI